MATERVQKPIWQPSSQKKQSPIVPPLIDSQTQADSLTSPKVPVSGVKSKAERDAIRRSLFEKWAGAGPQQMSESEVLGYSGSYTATETIQGQEALQAKDQMGMPIQAKLTIGKPGDKYEQEADWVADQVVNQINAPTPQQPVQSKSVQREAIPEENELHMKLEAGIIQREEMLEFEEELQMKPMVQLQSGAGGMAATSDLETSIQQERGCGQSLADNIREPMEQAFGADFSSVKVHTDAQSDQLNQSIQARAFTTGQDIFFRQGEYNPGSRGGQELIAHELTHVVQQNDNYLSRSSLLSHTFHISSTDQPTVQCVKFKNPASLTAHFQKHVTTQKDAGKDDDGNPYVDEAAYEQAAIDVVNSSNTDVVVGASKTYYLEKSTNQFVATETASGDILTMFVPKSNPAAYLASQK